ncbi:MAG: pteridine-dependent deoxygenase [Xanthomonadales bacterium]|nr:pteridine-dependent deoxygenase [Xanthomonadales bacterium]
MRPIETTSIAATDSLPSLQVNYVKGIPGELLAMPATLAVIGFGETHQDPQDPRFVRVGLEPIESGWFEVWRCAEPVTCGRQDALRWSSDGHYLFFAVEIDESEAGDIDAAAEQAYAAICRLIAGHRFADGALGHILRLWNYLDAINEGEGDNERYRHFCSGRAHGLNPSARNGYSAATAIGCRNGRRVLQVYGLAARKEGVAVENPRQVSAWSYPRQYGPVAPTFARATRTPAGQLLVSGTASVVGHQSQHAGDTLAQLDETLRNLDSLLAAAGPRIASRGIDAILLKIYLREPAEAKAVEQHLRQRLPGQVGLLILLGDICRSDLRIEIDGIQG